MEAALFMSANPLTLEQITKVVNSPSLEYTIEVLDTLITEFNAHDSAIELVRTHDGRYRMQVKRPILPHVKDLAVTTDFSKSVLRTLAIISFKQPIKQSIVVKMRGNKSYEHIGRLVEEGFIRKVKEGNTYLLETTKKFVDYFGESVQSLKVPSRSDLDSQVSYHDTEEVDKAQTTLAAELEKVQNEESEA